MADRVVEEHWTRCKPNVMDRRVDTLRSRADYLSRKIDHLPQGTCDREAREHAALMWAIAELTGIGDEVRRERADREHATASMYRRAMKRAEAAETLNVQYRVKVAALKAEVHRLSKLIDGKPFDD